MRLWCFDSMFCHAHCGGKHQLRSNAHVAAAVIKAAYNVVPQFVHCCYCSIAASSEMTVESTHGMTMTQQNEGSDGRPEGGSAHAEAGQNLS
jgi:hypothetical protein